MRLVKKYGNRKLYDTVEKRYVQLSLLLRAAQTEDVKVVDAQTERNLTASTLAQALACLLKDLPSENLSVELESLSTELVAIIRRLPSKVMSAASEIGLIGK